MKYMSVWESLCVSVVGVVLVNSLVFDIGYCAVVFVKFTVFALPANCHSYWLFLILSFVCGLLAKWLCISVFRLVMLDWFLWFAFVLGGMFRMVFVMFLFAR